jgi:hypothetical protein
VQPTQVERIHFLQGVVAIRASDPLQPCVRQVRQAIEYPPRIVAEYVATVTEPNADERPSRAEPVIPALGCGEVVSGDHVDRNATIEKAANRPESRMIEALAKNEDHLESA